MSLLNKNCIVFDIDADNKSDVILALVKQLKEAGKITDVDKFHQDVLGREAISPTFIGFDIGMPHGKTSNVLEAGIAFGRMTNPVVWSEETGDTADVAILIAVPEEEAGNTHMKILAGFSRRLMHEDFRNALRESNEEDLYKLLQEVLED